MLDGRLSASRAGAGVRTADAGDVMIFRLRDGLIAKHAAILTSRTSMIHSQSGDQVREVTMNGWWLRHAAGSVRVSRIVVSAEPT